MKYFKCSDERVVSHTEQEVTLYALDLVQVSNHLDGRYSENYFRR